MQEDFNFIHQVMAHFCRKIHCICLVNLVHSMVCEFIIRQEEKSSKFADNSGLFTGVCYDRQKKKPNMRMIIFLFVFFISGPTQVTITTKFSSIRCLH